MRGVGKIFEAFRDGDLEDDDEVAVVHGPAEFGFREISVAMVNIPWINLHCARWKKADTIEVSQERLPNRLILHPCWQGIKTSGLCC